MALPFVVHHVADRFSCANAAKIICFGATRAAAREAIAAAFDLSPAEIESALDAETDAATWLATFASATAAELQGLSDSLEGSATTGEVAAVNAKIETAMEQIGGMQTQIETDREQAAAFAAEAEYQKEFARILQYMKDSNTYRFGDEAEIHRALQAKGWSNG